MKKLVWVAQLGLLFLVAFAENAQAQTWSVYDRITTFSIFSDPGNPESPIAWQVRLWINAQAFEGETIGWQVSRIEITQHDENGEPAALWAKDSPNVAGDNGLWWIDHINPSAPCLQDFTVAPPIIDQLSVVSGAAQALDISIAGQTFDPQIVQLPFSPASLLDFVFQLDGESEPIDEGDNEPTMPADENPPQ